MIHHPDVRPLPLRLQTCLNLLILPPITGNSVRVQKGSQLLIPNAFSPGLGGSGSGDGRNDYFLPLMRGVSEFQMLVFNRWGELLFETKNAEVGWDGYYKGKLCPQDVYVYKITAKYENGNMITRVGDIHLIR